METTEWDVQTSIEKMLSIRASSSYAEASQRSLRAEGRKLISFFGADRKVRSIRPEEMVTYLQWRAEGNRPSSAGTMFAYVNGWIEFCQRAGSGMRTDLTENWRRPKAEAVRPTFVPPEAMPKIFQLASDRHPRDRALVAILYYTGLRSAEVAGLTVGNVDMRNSIVTARRTKVNDVKRIPMEVGLVAEMDRWLRFYSKHAHPGITERSALVPSLGSIDALGLVRTSPLTVRPMRRIIREVLLTAGFEGRSLGTHVLRRSAATTLHDRLADDGDADPLGSVGIFLGHNARATTERYLNRSHDDVKAAAMAAKGILTVETDVAEDVAHATVIDLFSRRHIA